MATPPAPSFEFINDITGFRAPGAFIARLEGRLKHKSDLLNALAASLKFPDYFGHNWDALDECLRDLSWLDDQKSIVLLHKHVPLSNDEQRRIYLDILKAAQAAHSGRLRVVFRASNEQETKI
jgi:RNAse (barnase) inhibitor barstar